MFDLTGLKNVKAMIEDAKTVEYSEELKAGMAQVHEAVKGLPWQQYGMFAKQILEQTDEPFFHNLLAPTNIKDISEHTPVGFIFDDGSDAETKAIQLMEECDKRGIEVDHTVDYLALEKKDLITILAKVKAHKSASIKQKIAIGNSYIKLGLELPRLASLTGTKTGSASELMEDLFKLIDLLPPTEPQVKIILDLILCPDFTTDILVRDGAILRSDEEIIGDIMKLTRSEASELIESNKPLCLAWQKTRLSINTENRLRQLMERDGNKVDTIYFKQFSQKQASDLINQLMMEKPKDYTNSKDNAPSIGYDDIRADSKETMYMKSFIHTLYASMGQIAEEETLLAVIEMRDCNDCDIYKRGFETIKGLIKEVVAGNYMTLDSMMSNPMYTKSHILQRMVSDIVAE